MLHEALMLEIYRQALNASMPTVRPRSTESANSSERCPSHDSNSSENGGGGGGGGRDNKDGIVATMTGGIMPMPNSLSSTFPAIPQNLPAQQQQSMEAYIHMVAAAAQYGFPMNAAAAGSRLPLPLPAEAAAPFKLPPQASPNASSNNSEALDYRTNLFGRATSAEPLASEEDDEDEEANNANNPLDLSVGTRKRSRDADNEPDSTIGQIQVKKIFKTESPPLSAPPVAAPPPAPMLQSVSPYLAAVAAASIFRTGQFPDWNGKSDLVIDPLEKMSDIVKGPRKEKPQRNQNTATPIPPPSQQQQSSQQQAAQQSSASSTTLPPSTEGMSKARHNIWQSHWQNKGVASSVFRCVWCKQSFSTLEALTTHMKDSKHCGVNVPPFGNLPNTDRHHQPPPQQSGCGGQHPHNLRKQGGNQSGQSNSSSTPSAAAKNAFQYRGDPPTPLPRKLVRGQNVWLGKGVEQAMQILKCMRCGESFRSLGEMTKHMQETQHYTNILSQEQTISMKSSAADNKDGQNSMSSEESRTLSAVLTCKVCDKAFNSFADLSSHMAKNNHYSEPLMQSMSGSAGNRKRPAPKKREKSLPVRKLLEMKGAQNEAEMEAKMQRAFDSAKRMQLEGTGMGPSNDKSESAIFAERMRQYITGVKSVEDIAKGHAQQVAANLLNKTNKSPELEPKNGATKSNAGSSSVLSAIEQMFTTSFDTPPRHASLPATSPSNSSNKNTSPVAASILKRLGIDETADYNKPLMDTTDPYFQHYRYNSSERSGSECSAETHLDLRKLDAPTPDKMQTDETATKYDNEVEIKKEPQIEQMNATHSSALKSMIGGDATGELARQMPDIKMEIKAEVDDEETKSPQSANNEKIENNGGGPTNGVTDFTLSRNNNKERSVTPPKVAVAGSPSNRATLAPRSPTDSHRSATPKSPASSIKSYDGEKKYPSDSLNALSSMFDSLGSSGSTTSVGSRLQPNSTGGPAHNNQMGSPENLSTSNSLAALRQFVKKEST